MRKYLYMIVMIFTALSCTLQDGMVDVVEIGVMEENVTLDCVAGVYPMEVLANGEYTATVTEGDWLSFDGAFTAAGFADGELSVTYQMNRGNDRYATIVLERGFRSCKVSFVQKGIISSGLSFESSNMLVDAQGGRQSAKILTLLKNEELSYKVDYEGAEGWISDIVKENNFLLFTALDNTSADLRSAVITVSSVADEDSSCRLHVSQSGNGMAFTDITFAGLNDIAEPGESVVVEESLVLEGRVINDNLEGNGSNNINISSSLQDKERTARVIYVQNEDATAGVMVEFNTVEDNTAARFDKVRLLLKGMTLTHKESTAKEPARYELKGAAVTNILSTEGGSAYDIPVKEKTISQLTDADVYTYVTLTDCEIPIRKGPYVPVDLRYTDAMNKYPMPLRDKDGSRTYLMTNLTAAWARDGKGLPQGAGKVSGVIVHEKCDNFEWDNDAANAKLAQGVKLDYITEIGTISRYQIRPVAKSEIAIAERFEDGFSDMLMEIRYTNRNYDNLVKNVDTDYNMYSTYPASPYPINDPDMGRFLRWNTGKQEMFSPWRDWTHLGPLENGRISDPQGGNGVYDFYGVSAHWNVHSATPVSGMIIEANGSAWYCSKWLPTQWWLVEFSTEDLTAANFPLSVNFGAENGLGETVGAARYWVVEYSLDNVNWTKVEDYTVPDFPIVYKKRSWQCPGFKYFTINLPEDTSLLGKEKVYVRLRPSADNAGTADAYDGSSVVTTCESALNYFSIRYNR